MSQIIAHTIQLLIWLRTQVLYKFSKIVHWFSSFFHSGLRSFSSVILACETQKAEAMLRYSVWLSYHFQFRTKSVHFFLSIIKKTQVSIQNNIFRSSFFSCTYNWIYFHLLFLTWGEIKLLFPCGIYQVFNNSHENELSKIIFLSIVKLCYVFNWTLSHSL